MLDAMNGAAKRWDDEDDKRHAAQQARMLQAFRDVEGVVGDLSGLFEALGVSADSGFGRAIAGMESFAGAASQGAQAFAQFTSGDILGGIRSGIGALTSVVQGFKGLFGDSEHEKVNDLRDAYVAAAGGITELDKKAQAAGTTVRRLLDAKTVAQYEAAIRQLNGAFDRQAEAQKRAEDAAKRYGLTIDELGAKGAQAELHKMFEQLWGDYEVLKASGADMNAVLAKMAPSFSEYVQQAIAAGQAIPESMRAIVEQLIAEGKLVDANGNAYESTAAAGITFAKDITEAIMETTQAIRELVAALTGVRSPGPIHIPVTTDYGGSGPHNAPAHETPAFDEGGHTGDGPYPFMALLHPRETVVPDAKMPALLARAIRMAGGSRGGRGDVILDGQKVGAWTSQASRRGLVRIHPNSMRGQF
jgi:hypothetical protein